MEQPDTQGTEHRFLQEYLATRDLPCPVCAYNLRGLESDHCPECGANLDIRIGSVDLRMGRWIAALILCALPVGFGLPISLLGMVAMFMGEFTTEEDYVILGAFMVPAVVFSGLLGVLIRKRRSFWRQPLARQRGLLAGSILLVGGLTMFYVWFFMNV